MRKLLALFIPLFSTVFAAAHPLESDKAVRKLRAMYFARDWEGATIEGRMLIAQHPNNIELQAWFIASMARNDQPKEAVALAEGLTRSYPQDPWSWFALAFALNFWSERSSEALPAIEKAGALPPDHPDVIWLKAELLMRQNRWQEAVAFLDRHLDKTSAQPEFLVAKAYALYQLSWNSKDKSDSDAALRLFEEIRKTDPSNVNAHFLPGFYLSGNRQYQEAYDLLRRAVELSPTSTAINTALWNCIMGLSDRGLEEKVAEVKVGMSALMKARPTYPGALSGIYSTAHQHKISEVQKDAEQKILELFQDSSQAEWIFVNRYRDFRKESGSEGLNHPARKAQYTQMLRDFIERPRHHRETLLGDAYRELFYSVKDDPEVTPDELLKVVQGMAKYEGINPQTTHCLGAKVLAERTDFFREAEQLARQGLIECRKRVEESRQAYKTEED